MYIGRSLSYIRIKNNIWIKYILYLYIKFKCLLQKWYMISVSYLSPPLHNVRNNMSVREVDVTIEGYPIAINSCYVSRFFRSRRHTWNYNIEEHDILALVKWFADRNVSGTQFLYFRRYKDYRFFLTFCKRTSNKLCYFCEASISWPI